jgi:hypothetical protein
MSTEKPILHATLTNAPGTEVRHLLIYFVNGARETRLVQLSNGLETPIATGTQYEMSQKADAVARLWITNEGFKRPKENFVFEPLERTVALAMKMGFTIVYDPSYAKIDPPRSFNLTGAVPLNSWPGMTPKNGGGYVYAFDQMRLYARPTLPPNHELNVVPSDPKEVPAYLAKVSAFLETVGPFREFILAGD